MNTQNTSKLNRVLSSVFLALSIFQSAAATNYTTLKSLGPPSSETRLYAGLIEGSDGVLYGAISGDSTFDRGAVFKITKDGSNYVVLHSFTNTASNERYPYARLTEGSDGALYGTTQRGGANASGAVFKLNKDGSGYQVLHMFGEQIADGQTPAAEIIEGANGTLYGTTQLGGVFNKGTIFAINKDGTGYQVLRTFVGISANDGSDPFGLIEGGDGVLYGVTGTGGTNGYGTIFSINKNGSGYRVLRSFTLTAPDGHSPFASLCEGSDGALYGTTFLGGTAGQGTVFKVNKNGTGYRLLCSFTNANGDGAWPMGKLVRGTDGALYGTTQLGGAASVGTVFKINENGSGYVVLHSFDRPNGDGGYPTAGLVEGRDGAFYGTTSYGGVLDFGTVFRITPPAYAKFSSMVSHGPIVRGNVRGVSGQSITVQFSTDVRPSMWTNLVSGTVTNGDFTFEDATASQASRRFYRAIVP